MAEVVDHKKKIPQLLNEGAFFLLFKRYVDRMLPWGLSLDITYEEYISRTSILENEKGRLIKSWINSHSQIPYPLTSQEINSEFIIIGHYLFSPNNISDNLYSDYRAKFNEISRKLLPRLIDVITQLPRLPNYYLQILQSYYSRYQMYSDFDK